MFILLFMQELYSDVTLACDSKFFDVHKLVLSVCSEYFEEILRKTTCAKPVIVLKDIKPSDLEALLNYMYTGEASVPHCDLNRLIKAAEWLKIKGLAVSDANISLQTNNKKRLPEDFGSKEEDSVAKKRKAEIPSSNAVHHSLVDIEQRISDSEEMDAREQRSTIVHHAGLRTPTRHPMEDSTSSSPQTISTPIILHHQPIPEHISLRHPLKHSVQNTRNVVHEEIIIPSHTASEVGGQYLAVLIGGLKTFYCIFSS